jgi:hypothetical protein
VGKVENDAASKAAILRDAFLSDAQVEEVLKYFRSPELNEIIVSVEIRLPCRRFILKNCDGLVQLQG